MKVLFDAPGDGSYTFKQAAGSFAEGVFMAGAMVATPFLGPGGVLGVANMVMPIVTGNFQLGPMSYNMGADEWSVGWGPVDYNITTKDVDYMFEDGNSAWENIQYGISTISDLGSIANHYFRYKQLSTVLGEYENQGLQLVGYRGEKPISGKKLLFDLWWHYQYGGGEDYNISVNSINWYGATQQKLGIDDLALYGIDRQVSLFSLGTNPTSLAFGTVEMKKYGNYVFGIMPNEFDFDYKNWSTHFKRNIGNTIGWAACNLTNGILTPRLFGGAFMVNFHGLLFIPY